MKTPTDRAGALLSTTIVLTATTLFARTIVVYYNVYLSGKIGAVGIGVFELLMSVYTFAKTASTAGVSLAATRMSAEENGSFAVTMRRILLCSFCLSTACGAILGTLAPFLCRSVLSDPPGGVTALRILSLALPFLSMSSAFGGYFVAKRKMRSYAPVQICEQLIRVALTITLLEHFSRDTLSFSIASIALAITLSEVVAFLFSLGFYLFLSSREKEARTRPVRFGEFLRSFSRLAVPVGGGAVFRASLNTVYNILVPYGLRRSGASAERSLSAYGIIQGMALPILLYLSAVTGSVSLQLVPEIAALRSENKMSQIHYLTRRVLRFTLLFSMTCASVLFVFSTEISSLVFGNADSAPYIRALAALVPVMYLDTVSDGILKGLDLQLKVLGIGIVDSFVSLTLIYFLLPPFGMYGYLITIYAGECINTLLGQIELRRHLEIRFSFWRDLLLPPLVVVCASVFTKHVLLSSVNAESLLAVSAMILSALCLSLLLFCTTGVLNQEELTWLRALLSSKKRREDRKRGDLYISTETQTRIPIAQTNIRSAGKIKRSER